MSNNMFGKKLVALVEVIFYTITNPNFMDKLVEVLRWTHFVLTAISIVSDFIPNMPEFAILGVIDDIIGTVLDVIG